MRSTDRFLRQAVLRIKQERWQEALELAEVSRLTGQVLDEVEIGSLRLANPVLTASGTFGQATEFEAFFDRADSFALGICNGCQLMIELDLVVPEHKHSPTMVHNESGKFESAFLSLKIQKNKSIMLESLEGMNLGVWVAHGEGKFVLPEDEKLYHIAAKYSRSSYPANPNGSDYDVAALCSADGRHLAMMPHLERAYQPWQCGYYPEDHLADEATPWLEAFVNARRWIESHTR